MEWEVVIGLEIHTQLATRSKIFSGAATAYGAEPNTQACAIDLAMPGTLPVLNAEAVRMAVMFGLAIEAEIPPVSVFARKNYFYPDLPKGYQISQYELPVVGKGRVEIVLEDGSTRWIGVTRAHLEEDAGKSLHEEFAELTGIDLNRAGTPLIEIVSEPDLRSAKEAVAYARKIHTLVRYLGISDGNMQEGSFRMDANVYLRPMGSDRLGTRTELKNLNSFRFLERAINYEIERQADILEGGGEITQETRLYDAVRNETRSMRTKEEANDYRYFPDPDLLPLRLAPEFIEEIREQLPELPDAKRDRFMSEYGLSREDAAQLSASREMADYFEEVARACGDAKMAANWLTGTVTAWLNREDHDIDRFPVPAAALGRLLARILDNTISGKIAKEVLEAMIGGECDGDPDAIIESRGLKQLSDTGALAALVDEVIAANPAQVEQYRAGKTKVLGFFVGQVMKKTQGKANPAQVNQLLRERLAQER